MPTRQPLTMTVTITTKSSGSVLVVSERVKGERAAYWKSENRNCLALPSSCLARIFLVKQDLFRYEDRLSTVSDLVS